MGSRTSEPALAMMTFFEYRIVTRRGRLIRIRRNSGIEDTVAITSEMTHSEGSEMESTECVYGDAWKGKGCADQDQSRKWTNPCLPSQ